MWRSLQMILLKQMIQITRHATIPVASLTTAISVGEPKPDRNNTYDTIFLYKLSNSSLVLKYHKNKHHTEGAVKNYNLLHKN